MQRVTKHVLSSHCTRPCINEVRFMEEKPWINYILMNNPADVYEFHLEKSVTIASLKHTLLF